MAMTLDAGLFILAIAALAYIPGKSVLLLIKQRLPMLEDFTLSCYFGLLLSSVVYWLIVFGRHQRFFYVWPLLTLVLLLLLWKRSRRPPKPIIDDSLLHLSLGERDASPLLLLAVFLIGVLVLALLPLYYRNLTYLPDGTMRVHAAYDVFFHLSIANELTYSIPPEAPVFSGHPLNYHYGMDLMIAMFARLTHLQMRDLMLRFMPTLFMGLSMLSIYCFARRWLKSGYFAVLAVFLIFFGEDLSFIPGWLLSDKSDWSVRFFNVPTVLSLFYLNSMLPALGLLFAGLLVLQKYLSERKAAWLFASAILFVALAEVKLFSAMQIMFSLGVGAIVYWLRFRSAELLKAAALTGLATTPLMLPIILRNQTAAALSVAAHPWPYIPIMLKAMKLDASFDHAPTLLLIGLPVYLVGCFGLRLAGIPEVLRSIVIPAPGSGLRFTLGCFVVLGAVLTLTFTIVPAGYTDSYNNSVWFLAQSKYLIWLFAVEVMQKLYHLIVAKGVRPLLAGLGIVTVSIALSVPSTIQHFSLERHPYQIYGKSIMADVSSYNRDTLSAMEFLADKSHRGNVVLPSETLIPPILALTKCVVPIGYFAKYLVAKNDFLRRESEEKAFWNNWRNGEVRNELISEAKVRYVIADVKSLGIPKNLPATFRLVFSNAECAIFEVREGVR